jgi:hypothetical protein
MGFWDGMEMEVGMGASCSVNLLMLSYRSFTLPRPH